jgi:hypothetical protein
VVDERSERCGPELERMGSCDEVFRLKGGTDKKSIEYVFILAN